MLLGYFSEYGIVPLIRNIRIIDKYLYEDILINHTIPDSDDLIPLKYYFPQDNDPKQNTKAG